MLIPSAKRERMGSRASLGSDALQEHFGADASRGPQYAMSEKVIRYTNMLLYQCAISESRELVLKHSEPLPTVEETGFFAPIPDFWTVVNRLRVMSGIPEEKDQDRTEAHLKIRVNGQDCVVHICFEDGTRGADHNSDRLRWRGKCVCARNADTVMSLAQPQRTQKWHRALVVE